MFLQKCLEAASAESMRKGTKKLAKNKKKWDLFSFYNSLAGLRKAFMLLLNSISPTKNLFKIGKNTENTTFNIK
ncbi:hypothetical protein [Segatella copri]|uniref:hypothetical protein n=1 Tax=Segatella copri TaxID=165179 RepID=UPI0025FC1723|nr:hypothetical protein [Segatella copri]